MGTPAGDTLKWTKPKWGYLHRCSKTQGQAQHNEALDSALSWPEGIVGSWWASGSEALVVGVIGDALED